MCEISGFRGFPPWSSHVKDLVINPHVNQNLKMSFSEWAKELLIHWSGYPSEEDVTSSHANSMGVKQILRGPEDRII